VVGKETSSIAILLLRRVVISMLGLLLLYCERDYFDIIVVVSGGR